MDLQRTLLIVGLAVVSYMMILQWNADYDESAVKPSTTASTENNTQSYPQVVNDTPKAEQEGDGDIPTAIDNTVPEAVPAVAAPAIQNRLITVTTDTFNIKINPVGGDIESLELADYDVSIHHDQPLVLLQNTADHTYISQSGLVGPDGPDANKKGRPHYTSAKAQYSLGDGETLNVDLMLQQDSGVVITKRFTFTRGEYLINVSFLINNKSDKVWQGALFGQIKRDSSEDPGTQGSTGFGLPTFIGAAYWDTDAPYNKLDFEDLSESPVNKKIPGGWIALIQHYFMTAWIPDSEITHRYIAKNRNGNNLLNYTSPVVAVAPGQQATLDARFYAGPKILKVLENIPDAEGIDLSLDYGPLFFISKPLFWILDMFHSLTASWGIAIILLTVVVKLIFFPLSAASYRSMANMRRVQPKLVSLKERFGDDRQKMSQEMMKLYKDEKINPLGGCLPILIQMPVFLALYWALLESVELRHASFLWIQDLANKDPYFILPLLMGGTMFVQQMLNPAPPDPMQARMMRMMPIIFTIFFLWFPAGLVLYWVTNNLLSIAQQWYITRSIENAAKS